jgi:hypothetical protein
MYLTESSVAVAAPVKGGLGKRQALSKVTVKNDTTNNRDCMMDALLIPVLPVTHQRALDAHHFAHTSARQPLNRTLV